MGALLTLIPKPLLYGAIGIVAGAALLSGAYHYGKHEGRAAERQAILERSVDLLRERNRTDDEVSRFDDRGLCSAIGGKLSDDGTCQ